MHSIELTAALPALPALLDLYESVGWTAYTAEPERLLRAVQNSRFRYFFRENGRLIGLLRAVGDGETILYVQDILINCAILLLTIFWMNALEKIKHHA